MTLTGSQDTGEPSRPYSSTVLICLGSTRIALPKHLLCIPTVHEESSYFPRADVASARMRHISCDT